MRYRDLVEDFKKRGEDIRRYKKELDEENRNYLQLESEYAAANFPMTYPATLKYKVARKAIISGTGKPTDEEMDKLKELSEQYKKDLAAAREKDGIYITGFDKTLLNKKLRKSAKRIRQLERMIYTEGRKNMHLHIALSWFRGTPLNKILSSNTRKKIRPESVYEFLECITEY